MTDYAIPLAPCEVCRQRTRARCEKCPPDDRAAVCGKCTLAHARRGHRGQPAPVIHRLRHSGVALGIAWCSVRESATPRPMMTTLDRLTTCPACIAKQDERRAVAKRQAAGSQ